ncbi:erythromycin esterase family protein [Paenibacillus albidus]|uniref:erythromycin esterase family protein n=1 Tax=Paenibacillus albidus TaxID=2041023 RepID=UPI001BED047C|nr:erythromycin esterase family protein [Paenibacillus albidus]MBT2291689.1 erythromycin esterase family protein [Paenibacillus albidus]
MIFSRRYTQRMLTALSALVLSSLCLSPASTAQAATNAMPYAHEIKSLTSEDYSDLAFLKPLLAGKTVVSLGENFHRVGEYASLKTRLVKYLHQELGFEVIAFESGLGEAAMVNNVADEVDAATMMYNSIFDVWKSKETLELFNYIKKTRQTSAPLQLAGYDMQYTSQIFTIGVRSFISKVNIPYGEAFMDFDTEAIHSYYSLIEQYGLEQKNDPVYQQKLKQVIEQYVPQYKEYIRYIRERRELFDAAYPQDPYMTETILKGLEDRIHFLQQGQIIDTQEFYEARDRIMAEHVEWLMKVRYPGKKIILWAHNEHLAKNTSKIRVWEQGRWQNSFTSMGELLHQRLKDKMYVMGFYMNRGKAAAISTLKEFSIGPMPKGTLEARILQSGHSRTFVDLSRHTTANSGNSWMFKPLYAAEDGLTREVIIPMAMKFVPKEQFDGLVVIDKVNPPTVEY